MLRSSTHLRPRVIVPPCLLRHTPRIAVAARPSLPARFASSSILSVEDRVLKVVPLLLQKSEQQQAENAALADHQAPTPGPTDGWGKKEIDEVKRLWAEMGELNKQLAGLDKLSLEDPIMAELANEEREALQDSLTVLHHSLQSALLPAPPPTTGAILEFKPGVGGAEATLFTAEIVRMYERFAGSRAGWQVEMLRLVAVEAGGSGDALKEATMRVVGKDAFETLRHEAGVHRVQRIPSTQNTGKLQTSTMAVVVLPEAEESGGKDVLVDEADVKVELMRSRGAGGQHVNKTESAIRLTHEPTGITVSMQDSRSQHQNRAKAWQILRARLLDRQMRREASESRDARRSQVGSMERSDRIRTYNFPQDRVTDHRIGMSLSAIDRFMDGDTEPGLSDILTALKEHEVELRLAALHAQLEAPEQHATGKGGKGKK